jgi:hypothetical protein
MSSVMADTTAAPDATVGMIGSFVTESYVIAFQFSYSVITNSPLYATNVTKRA